MSFSKEIQVILARQLASCLAMPILIADTEGTLVFYNEPAEAILNQRFEETGEMPATEWVKLFAIADEERNLIPPDRVMFRFLVCRGSVRIPINLHQHKARGIISLLDHVEARDARLLTARAGVGECGFLEGVHKFRFHADMNMNDKHGR